MKRTTIRSAVGAALAGGAICLSSLGALALSASHDEAPGANSQAPGSTTFSGPERDEERLWPATHYPEVQAVRRPVAVDHAQTSGPARDEHRLWPVVHYPVVQTIARRQPVERARMSGPVRDEHRLWPVIARADEGHPRNGEMGSELAEAPESDAGREVRPVDSKEIFIASR